ncbi:hypothetical protein [Pseudoalteromonas sp. McH1-42]|uniref:hypothetical protein n=1 Tax=Pseudoalteromonas sp. McH1-42 TaxID=2917752 RepID=UPI001EF71441|nr:hypothetical protein [Pseudoalteromonas sp. McH1-42]MCG7563108.1 hypothetical protein [Pseudoalteromonas sp. McH1-42]
MKQIVLSPQNGWQLDQLNMNVITEIYNTFTPLYEKKLVKYLTFTVEASSFEDKDGNTLWFEFFMQEDIREEGHLIKLEVYCKDWLKDSKSLIVQHACRIKEKFGLTDVIQNDD